MNILREAPRRRTPRLHTNGDGTLIELLSERETEVLRLAAIGLSYLCIAERLGISERTVRTHMFRVLGKYGVKTRYAAILTAIQAGIVPPYPDPDSTEAALRLARYYLDLAEELAKKERGE